MHMPCSSQQIFAELADEGNARGQLGLGFMFSTGLESNSSQAKVIDPPSNITWCFYIVTTVEDILPDDCLLQSLVYLTFSALGGDELAQMMLVRNDVYALI